MNYIVKNIGKVKSIVIKQDEDQENIIRIGFTAEPINGDDYGVGEASLFVGFNLTGESKDADLIKHISSVLKLGIKVTERGVGFLISDQSEEE